MKRKGLCALIALVLGSAGAVSVAHAQDTGMQGSMEANTGYSSWYIVPRIGVAVPDSGRQVQTSAAGGIGVGFWVNPNLTIDVEGLIDNADYKDSSIRSGKQWESIQLDVAGRWYFMDPASAWRPYVMGGIGAVRHAAVSGVLARAGGPSGIGPREDSWGPMATVGVGVLYNVNDRVALRGELAARYYRDTVSAQLAGLAGPGLPHTYGPKQWLDGLATVGLVIKMGHAAPPPPPPAAPPPVDCSQMDSDHDGVNDCNDKCPNTPPGTIVGPDGCPQNVVIDLRGVNFKFDRPRKGETNIAPTLKEPTADSMAILDQAVDTLNRYPQVQIEIDGYTDSIGTEKYNQGLSERRANIVDQYLTSHGISSDRITAVKGFGETHPIDTN
ncbi:MAG TPA: OmpA family protein, partial [Rhodanobacteraceae bacterium]|nr:OmpA family protein [Rhodanobacteraceae bacterium]